MPGRYPIKFHPEKAFAMQPMELHMLLTLLIGEDPTVLEKAKMPALRSLLTAYAKEGETAKTGGKKPALLERVVEAVRGAGPDGFSRPPIFGEGDVDEVEAGSAGVVEAAAAEPDGGVVE